ncbi:MAG: hypothetical protein Q9187_003718 [Circinaria calcarea]
MSHNMSEKVVESVEKEQKMMMDAADVALPGGEDDGMDIRANINSDETLEVMVQQALADFRAPRYAEGLLWSDEHYEEKLASLREEHVRRWLEEKHPGALDKDSFGALERGLEEARKASEKAVEEHEEEARRQELLEDQAAKRAAVLADKAAALKKRQEENAASKAATPAPTNQRPLHRIAGATGAIPMPRPGMTLQEQSDVLYQKEADYEAMQARRGGGTWGGPSRGYRSAAPHAPLSTRPRAPPNAPTGPARQEKGVREVNQPSAETVKRQEAELQHWKVAQKEKQRLQGRTAKVASLEDRISGKVEKKASTPTQRGGSFQIRGASRGRGNIPLGPRSASVRPTQAMRPPPTPSPARPSVPPVTQSTDVATELAQINLERERLILERERERLALERERERLALEREQVDHKMRLIMLRLAEDLGRSQETSTQSRRHRSRSASPGRRSPIHYDGYRTPRSPAEYGHGGQNRAPTGSRYPAPVPPPPAFAPTYTPSVTSQGSHPIRSRSSGVSQEEFSRNWLPRQGIRAGNQALHDSQAIRARLRAREREVELMKQKIAAKELDKKKNAEAARAITARAGQLDDQVSTAIVVEEDRPASAMGDTGPLRQPEQAPETSTTPEAREYTDRAAAIDQALNLLRDEAVGFFEAWHEAANVYTDDRSVNMVVLDMFAARIALENSILSRILELLIDVRDRLNGATTLTELDHAVDYFNSEVNRLGFDDQRADSNRELLQHLPKEKIGPLDISDHRSTGKEMS